MVLPFWYWLTQVVLEKRPIMGIVVCFEKLIIKKSNRYHPYKRHVSKKPK